MHQQTAWQAYRRHWRFVADPSYRLRRQVPRRPAWPLKYLDVSGGFLLDEEKYRGSWKVLLTTNLSAAEHFLVEGRELLERKGSML